MNSGWACGHWDKDSPFWELTNCQGRFERGKLYQVSLVLGGFHLSQPNRIGDGIRCYLGHYNTKSTPRENWLKALEMADVKIGELND